MHSLPCKFIHALDFRPFWLTELAHSADKKITRNCVAGARLGLFAAFGNRDTRPPFLELVIPSRYFSSGAEANVLVELVFLRHTGQIRKNFFLAWEIPAPIAVGGKAVAVDNGLQVDSAAGIRVIVPIKYW